MCEHGIACALRWGVAVVGVYPTGHFLPCLGTPCRYREYTGGWRSLEVAVMKKTELWLVIHFCKEAWNKLFLDCILCKKNCKNILEQPCSNL